MDNKSRATFIDLLHQILWKKEFIIVKFQSRVFQVTKRQLANLFMVELNLYDARQGYHQIRESQEKSGNFMFSRRE